MVRKKLNSDALVKAIGPRIERSSILHFSFRHIELEDMVDENRLERIR
jgi:hypothetical protein